MTVSSTWRCLVGGVAREYQKLGRLLKSADFDPYDHVFTR